VVKRTLARRFFRALQRERLRASCPKRSLSCRGCPLLCSSFHPDFESTGAGCVACSELVAVSRAIEG
jgi:hypothetical protein